MDTVSGINASSENIGDSHVRSEPGNFLQLNPYTTTESRELLVNTIKIL